MPRKPASPAILWFIDKYGFLSPEIGIRSLARKLGQHYSDRTPPFDPAQLATYRRINQILFELTGREAMLIPTTDGFKVQVNSSIPKVRSRFGLAHEIGHTFFFDFEGTRPFRPYQRPGADLMEERLCDIFAEEILMPKEEFLSDARKCGVPSLAAFLQLAKLYAVSTRCAAIRIQNLAIWNVAIVCWQWHDLKRIGKTEHITKMRVKWAAAPKGFFIPIGDSVDSNSIIYTCYHEKPQSADTVENLDLGAIRGPHHIECQRINSTEGPVIISIIQLDPSIQ